MRELIVTEFVSLDGVMEAPGGEPGYAHSGWVQPFFDDGLGRYKLDETLAADAQLLGRVTYESFAGAWPDREGAMADKLNAMPKHVASTTLDRVDWNNSTLLQGDVAEAVGALKATDGGPLLVAGSRTLVHTLLAAGLVDELHLQVFPLLLGSGARVYPEGPEATKLRLVDSVTFDSGVIAQIYRPDGAA